MNGLRLIRHVLGRVRAGIGTGSADQVLNVATAGVQCRHAAALAPCGPDRRHRLGGADPGDVHIAANAGRHALAGVAHAVVNDFDLDVILIIVSFKDGAPNKLLGDPQLADGLAPVTAAGILIHLGDPLAQILGQVLAGVQVQVRREEGSKLLQGLQRPQIAHVGHRRLHSYCRLLWRKADRIPVQHQRVGILRFLLRRLVTFIIGIAVVDIPLVRVFLDHRVRGRRRADARGHGSGHGRKEHRGSQDTGDQPCSQ